MEDACSVSLLQTTKSRTLETQLAGQLTSLSDASATGAHLTRTRKAPAAVRTGQDVHYFRRLREQHFMELLEVPEMPHWSTLRDTMQQEEAACLQSDFSPETLPLILHQFFVDRIASLVRLRLMYMQRWSKQQNVNSLGTTALYERYKQHLSMVMTEYDDCVQRAERLASAHDACLAGKPVRLGLVKDEDVNIYLRHLVLTEQSWRDPSAFLAQLKWLPHSNLHVLHQLLPVMDVNAWENEADARNELTKLRAMAPRANVQWKIAFQKRRATVPNPTDVANSTSKPKLPLPLLSKVLQRPKSETIQQESIAEVGDKPYCLSSPLEEYNDYGDVTPHVHCERAYRAVLARLLTTYGLQSSWNYEKKSDQLEMFKLVSDKFKTTMERQGKQMTFKVYLFPEHLEDKKPADAGKTPRTSCNRIWLKEANWQDESKLVPYVDPVQEEVVSQLRNNTKIDELLRLSMDACQLHHAEKVIYSLKRHVATSRKPPPLSSLSRPSTTQYRSTKRDDHVPALTQMWEQILKGVDPFDPSFRINGGKSRAGSGRPRNLPDDAKQVDHGADGVDPFAKIQTSSFDFNSASRVLAEQQESLFGSHQQQSEELLDSFTAFTMLRHLRIRDLRRTALSIFNYFRSVERSLVIGLTGLAKGKQPGKAGTTQAYVFEKPSDYQISAQEFMEIQEVSNHDDRHVVEGGRVQVKDQWKYHVVYDVAVDDLKKLEDYLVLVGSYYLVKHHSSAAATADDARRFAFLPEESDMASLSGQAVDRFAVLLDLWNCHVRFMERKHALLDCYLEAYHNVYDQQEKERLAQVIIDIIYQQPRHVLEANWFLRCYKTEIECLELHREIAHTVLTSQISAQRMFFTGLFPSGSSPNMVGVPLPTLSKCPISLSTSSALGQVFLLEFHPSLCVASRLPAALRHAANWTFFQMGKVGTHNVLRSCHATFQLAVRKLGESNSLIQAYSSEVRQALFQNPLMENPLFVTSLIPQQKKVAVKAVGGDSSDPAELKKAVASAYCDVLHFVSSYHRLADACLESSQLLKGYHLLSDPLGFGQMHAFMRMASIDVAASNPGTILKPLFLTSITTEGKDMFDQYIPVSVPLAAHEIDDKVFALQLSTKEDIIKMLSASSLETFRAILYAQVAQKNALIIGVLHTRACCQIHKTSASLEHVEAAVDSGSSLAALTSGKPRVSSAQLVIGLDLVQKLTDMFVSLQLHKAASRDMVLHELLTQPGISSKLQSPQENVKVKRVTLVQYFEKLGSLLAPQALRIQLSSCMFSLHQLLRDFPGTRDAVFEIGQDTDYKSGTGKRPQSATTAESGEQTPSHGIPVFEPSFRAGRSRARAFMTVDGKHLMNLFFLPHPLEALAMFRSLDLDEAMPALNSALRLLTCLHDICSIICARAKLNCPILQASGGSGGGQARRRQGSPPILNAYSTGLSADWGGLERITSELQELRKAIQKLECPTDPVQVAEYLESVREVRYRQLLVVVRDILPTTFLDMGDEQGAQIVQAKSRQCLDIIANVSRYSACQFLWNGRPVPQPLHVMKKKAARLMPLAKFTSDRGPYPHCVSPPTELSKQCIAMFCCLHNEQLNITHGVLCEMTLLQNEACQDAAAAAAAAAEQSLADSSADQGRTSMLLSSSASLKASSASLKKSASSMSRTSTADIKPKSKAVRKPSPTLDSEAQLAFLSLSSRLGILRSVWFVQQSGPQALEQSSVYSAVQRLYQTSVFEKALNAIITQRKLTTAETSQVRKSVAVSTTGIGDSGVVTEMEMRQALVEALVDSIECHMLVDLQNRVTRDMTQVQTEMIRNDGTLPTEVWKKLYTKVSTSVPQSAVVTDLSDALMDKSTESGDDLVISKKDFEACFRSADQASVIRDRRLFDGFTVYYENMVQKAQHQLQLKDREIAHWKEQSQQQDDSAHQAAESLLMEQCNPLIMEIISLRVCLQNAESVLDLKVEEARAEFQRHYQSLAEDLFNTSKAVQKRMEEYRCNMFGDIATNIRDLKQSALADLQQIRSSALTSLGMTEDSDSSTAVSDAANELQTTHSLQLDNAELVKALNLERSLNQWRVTTAKQAHIKQLADAQLELERLRVDSLNTGTATAQASQAADQQKDAMKKRLAELEEKLSESEQQMEAERVANQKRRQREQVVKPIFDMYQPTVEDLNKLRLSLQDAEHKLAVVQLEVSQERRMTAAASARTKKDVKQLQGRLQQERAKKVEAYTMLEKYIPDDSGKRNAFAGVAHRGSGIASHSATALLSADFSPDVPVKAAAKKTRTKSAAPHTLDGESMLPHGYARSVTSAFTQDAGLAATVPTTNPGKQFSSRTYQTGRLSNIHFKK